jgi:hypothetical protein
MSELKERFSLADRIESPDLWNEARRRAITPAATTLSVSWQPDRRKRAVAALVAFAVFAGAAVFAWNLSHPELAPTPQPEPAVDLASELPTGWSELPAPPEVRSDAATAWTGSELLVWGGYEYVGGNEDPGADGFAFDAAVQRWEPLPPSPLEGRSGSAFAWTGQELLIWGGWDGGFRDPPYFGDGAAYDPVSGTWRMLSAAPIDARTAFSVWTGEEMIVWGSTDRADRRLDGAAYDPITNAWRIIADGPIDITDGSAVWTGDEMIVFGAALDSNNHSDTPTAVAAAYDPAADAWRELPPSDLSPQAMTAAWLNGELIAWDYDHGTAAYDPVTDAWRDLPRVPLSFSECRPESVATARLVFGNYCGLTVVFSSEDDAWHREPIDGLGNEDCCRVLEPVVVGNVVLVPTHSYGMGLGTPDRRMFAYNSPPVVRTDPMGEVLDPESFFPPTERDGDLLRMPVIFPDGSEATLVYPIPLNLELMGVQPDLSYSFRGRYQGPIVFLHDPNASIRRFVDPEGAPMLINWSVGGLELWPARGDDGYSWIRLELPSWTVLVPIEIAGSDSPVERAGLAATVAGSLGIRESASGFPVVDASGEAELAEGFGEAGGAQLAFGDAAADPGMVSQLDATIFLSPDGCDPATVDGSSACLGGGTVFASIYGDRDFVASVVDGLRVEDFRQM